MNLRLELIYLVRITFEEFIGLAGLAYCIVNWKRHLRQSVMIKIMRRLIEEEKKNTEGL
jgi:hypothetical protein